MVADILTRMVGQRQHGLRRPDFGGDILPRVCASLNLQSVARWDSCALSIRPDDWALPGRG